MRKFLLSAATFLFSVGSMIGDSIAGNGDCGR